MYTPALFANLREQLASELYCKRVGTRNIFGSFGRTVDSSVIWFLFVRMCEQRKVSVPDTTILKDCVESDFLTERFAKFWKGAPSFSSPLPIEILSSAYETFLRTTISLTRNGPRFESAGELRKTHGVYYTPQYVVDYIVEETVGRLLSGKSPREILAVRVLDPACGTGRFLLRVFDRIVEEHQRRFEAHRGDTNGDGRPSFALKREILRNCIFGVDIDELAVEVTKLSLYLKLLEAEPPPPRKHPPDPMTILGTNIRCGDSLLPPARSGGFDVVLGNPPYGAELSAETRAALAKQFNAGTTETAALMMLHASRSLTRSGGFNGFIVPKAFTYSSSWRKVRDELLTEMTSLIDVGKVWPEVRLEQVIYLLQKGTPSKSYTNLKRNDQRFDHIARTEKQHCRDFGFLLNGISREELEVGLKIQRAGSFLSEYVSNVRGAMFQKQVTGERNGRRVIGGKQIQRFHILGDKGFVPRKTSLGQNAFVAPESILVQNIVAHIENPIDHIKITAAIVDKGLAGKIVILDTVNQLTNRSNLSSWFFLAILNSQLMNWYVYRFIYAKAIRTMHFDGPVTSRIPVPRIMPANQHLYEKVVEAAKAMAQNVDDPISQDIESALRELYGLSASDVAVIGSGMPSSTTQAVSAVAARP